MNYYILPQKEFKALKKNYSINQIKPSVSVIQNFKNVKRIKYIQRLKNIQKNLN